VGPRKEVRYLEDKHFELDKLCHIDINTPK